MRGALLVCTDEPVESQYTELGRDELRSKQSIYNGKIVRTKAKYTCTRGR